MDATRIGITFQEAQAVLRNIRRKQQETSQPPPKYEHERSLSNSPYFTVSNTFMNSSEYSKLIYQTRPSLIQPQTLGMSIHRAENMDSVFCLSNGSYKDELQSSRAPNASPKASSIGKRLEALRQNNTHKQENHTRTTRLGKAGKSTNSDSSWLSKSPPKKLVVMENSVSQKSDSQPPKLVKHPTQVSNNYKPTSHAGVQMNITSYLPKVKNQNKISEAQTHTEDNSFHKLNKVASGNIKSMSLEEREFIKKKILAASNIACTLIYENGNTLLRPSTAKSTVKAIYLIFSKDITSSSQDCSRVLFPVTILMDSNSEYNQWLREFLLTLMVSESNKMIYDAQKFIKALIKVFNIEDHSVCFHWRYFDPKIASWLLNPDHPPQNYDELLRNGFGNEKLSNNKEDKKNEMEEQVDEDMFSLLSLISDMFLTLQEKKLWELFSEMEMKISPILAAMELAGVEIDTKLLIEYGTILNKRIKDLEQEGYKCVGHPFQMNSPQQLRQILFDELKLDKNVQKRLARTQIKNYKSTSENVLKHLQDFHPLPKIILEYRSVTKVKSAYVDGLLHLVENDTLHTNWNQTCTATGRLTSTNPNIQAIPKNPLDICGATKQFVIGKETETISVIPRKAFKSRTGWSFVSADFQSIELRLLAHFSEDPLLLRIFNESDHDIFVQLASTWLSVDPESVQIEDRERAKRVVYSVVYGVGKERLADTLNVSANQAKSFTTSFLATFSGLKQFIQSCIDQCRKQGHVTTIFGRRRLLPGINSTDLQIRSQSERQAVNFVIQGSAADICKIGMISVVQALESNNLKLKARLLVQIHDELVLEVHDDYVRTVKELVKDCLENTDALCGGHVKLKVNLKVSVSFGKTWAEMQPFWSENVEE